MALARFKIEEKKQETKQVDKMTAFAGVHFSIKINGVEDKLPRQKIVEHDGVSLHAGTEYHHEISGCGLYLTHYGVTMAKSREESDRLVVWKPKLEAAMAKLARALTADQPPPAPLVTGKKNLLTGELLPAETQPAAPKREIVVEYAFIEPKVERVAETSAVPSRLWFSCVVPPPAEVTGRAGDLTVRFARGGSNGLDGSQLSFSQTGWVCDGRDAIDRLRAKYADATIEAAFKDLAAKWLALDATPKDAVEWCGVTTTSVQLV